MKNIVICFVLALALAYFCGFASAQSGPLDTGSKILSGSFRFDISGSGNLDHIDETDQFDRDISIWFSPSIRYFIAPGIAVGGSFGFSGNYYEHSSRGVSLGIGPRFTFFMGENRGRDTVKGAVYPFIDAGAYGSFYVYESEWNNWESRTRLAISASLGAGVCYMLSDAVGLTVRAGGDIGIGKWEEEDTRGYYDIALTGGLITFLY